MANGDGFPRGRSFGQVRGHRFVEAERSSLHEEHDGGGRELLTDRPGLEQGLGGDRDLMLQVREPVSFRHHHGPAADDRDRDTRDLLTLHLRADERVDVVGEARLSRSGRGRQRQKRDGCGQPYADLQRVPPVMGRPPPLYDGRVGA